MEMFAAHRFDRSRKGLDVGGVLHAHEHFDEWNGVQCHRCVLGRAYCDCFRLYSTLDSMWLLWRLRVSCGDEARFGRYGMDVGSVTRWEEAELSEHREDCDETPRRRKDSTG